MRYTAAFNPRERGRGWLCPGRRFPHIYTPSPPRRSPAVSQQTSLNWTGGSVYLSSFSSGPRGGVVFDGGGAMLAAAASSPTRPSSSTLLGHDAPNPSIHGQQLDPGCVDHPVAPLAPEHDGSNWGQDTSQPGALWAGSDRHDNRDCPKCRHDATTTCPWVRGPPLELQPAFFIGEFRTTCLPLSRVTNAKVEHRPTCHRGYYHR